MSREITQLINEARRKIQSDPCDHNLIEIVNILENKNYSSSQTDVWKFLLDTFEFPTSPNRFKIWPNNKLKDDTDITELDLLDTLLMFIDKETEEPEIYLHAANHYFLADQPGKARNILKKGLKYSYSTDCIHLYYCQNISYLKANTNTIESRLLPILEQREEAHYYSYRHAFIILGFFYLASKQFQKFKELQKFDLTGFADLSFTFSLAKMGLEEDGEYSNPKDLLSEWLSNAKKSFFENTPEYIIDEKDSIYSYGDGIVFADLFCSWGNDNFYSLIENNLDFINLDYLSDCEYANSNYAFTNLIYYFFEHAPYEHKDAWALIYFAITKYDSFIPRLIRDEIPDLARKHDIGLTHTLLVKYVAWWGDKSIYGNQFLDLIYDEIRKEAKRQGYEDLNSEYLYEILITDDENKKNGSRPILYYANHINKSLQTNSYDESFLNGIWEYLVRPFCVSSFANNHKSIRVLTSTFNDLLPLDDPLFVLAWQKQSLNNHQEAISDLMKLLNAGKKWYAIYRNISYSAETLGDIELAYEFEKIAHDDEDINIPEKNVNTLKNLEKKLIAKKEEQESINGADIFFHSSEDKIINIKLLDYINTIKLISYVKNFSIPGTDKYRPLLSQSRNWLPGENSSLNYANQMISDGTGYLNGVQNTESISLENEKFYFNHRKLSFVPNFPKDVHLNNILAELHDRFDTLYSELDKSYQQELIKPYLIEDLTDFAKERFQAYEIPIDFKARFFETAESCLEHFSLDISYGFFYHEIEDAAAKQREDGMSNQHTINFGLKCVRNKARSAYEYNWELRPYERSRSASEPSYFVSELYKLGLLD